MAIGRVPGATGIQPSIVDAKGDLIAATAADSVSRLAAGSNNQVLTADSAEATGLKYAAGSRATLTTTGDILYASAANTPARLAIGSTSQVLTVSGGIPAWATPASGAITSAAARVETDQDTTSGTYTDLTTAGPAVTLTTGTKVLVIVGCSHYGDTTDKYAYASYAISGATTSSASDDYAVYTRMINAAFNASQASVASVRTVTAGSNTFTMKYRVSTPSNAHFYNRQIIVIDLGS